MFSVYCQVVVPFVRSAAFTRSLPAQWPFSELMSVASSFTASRVGSDVVASALARAMAQQLAVSASDIEVAVTAASDGSGMGVAYAIEAESAASAAVILSQIAAMDLAALLASVLSELEAACLADVAIDDVSGIQPRLSYCASMPMLEASPLPLALCA